MENTGLRCGLGRFAETLKQRRARPRLELLESRLAPASLNLVSNWNGGGTSYGDLWAAGNYAYIGHVKGHLGVDIIDISNPANPVQVAIFTGNADGNLRDIDVQNNIGYFMSNNSTTGGVYVVDLHDPTHPVQLSFIPMSASGVTGQHSVAVSGNYLYETTGNSPDVPVFDISNPASPVFVRDLKSPSGAFSHEVTIVGKRLYVGMMNNVGYTDIWDITNVGKTSIPVPLLTEFVSGPGTHTVWPSADGNYAYVSHELTGGTASVFDIHNLAKPFLAGQIPPLPLNQAGSLQDVQVVGNLLYISWYQAGAYVYDISNPINPILVGSYDTYPGTASGINQGVWGVDGFYGPNEILASDVNTGLYIFSVPTASIQGQVFADANGNGKLDSGEVGIAGRTVYLDANNNGILDPGEQSTATDANGNYSFTNLVAGAYRVREVLPSGWTQTTTNPAPITAAVGTNLTGINFGAFQSSITGNVFNDINGNGVADPGEPGLAGTTVFLDTNHDGKLDQATTTLSSTDTPVAMPDLGYGSSTITASGLVGAVTHVSVTLNITHPFDSDLIITLIGPEEQCIVLVNREGGSGQNFTNTVLDDLASTPIALGSAPFTGTFQPETPLAALIGANPNGAWTLSISDVSPNDAGTIQSWSIAITTSKPTAVSDANGNYSFTGLPAGTYSVGAVTPPGWTQTSVNPAAVSVNTSGATMPVSAVGFFQLVTLSGHVFADTNGNGQMDSGEPGLAGFKVFIDGNHNGVLDPGEVWALTDSQGNFSIAGRGPYTFTVRIVTPTGWMRTTINPADFKPTSGQNVSGLNFGEFQFGKISGNVFNDLNGNGTKDSGEPGLAGWTVFIDQNHDGVPDVATTTVSSTDTPISIPSVSQVFSNLLVNGVLGTISHVTVSLNINFNFDSDLGITLYAPNGTSIVLVNHRGGSGHNFTGTILDDLAANSIATGVAPFTGSYRPERPLSAVNGLSPDGVWTLFINEPIRFDSGTFLNWSLNFTTSDPTAITDSSGNYTFSNLPLGTFTVLEVAQAGWNQTSANPAAIAIAASGTSVTGVNFGDKSTTAALAARLGLDTGPVSVSSSTSSPSTFALSSAIAARSTVASGSKLRQASLGHPSARTRDLTATQVDEIFASLEWPPIGLE